MEAGAPETAPQDQQVHHPNLKTFALIELPTTAHLDNKSA